MEEVTAKLNEKKHFGLIVFNTKENFDIIIENWDKLIKFNFLTIYFVNPFSSLDKKWIINPSVHHKICDESSLKLGLKSMFESVDVITEKEIDKL